MRLEGAVVPLGVSRLISWQLALKTHTVNPLLASFYSYVGDSYCSVTGTSPTFPKIFAKKCKSKHLLVSKCLLCFILEKPIKLFSLQKITLHLSSGMIFLKNILECSSFSFLPGKSLRVSPGRDAASVLEEGETLEQALALISKNQDST